MSGCRPVRNEILSEITVLALVNYSLSILTLPDVIILHRHYLLVSVTESLPNFSGRFRLYMKPGPIRCLFQDLPSQPLRQKNVVSASS